MPPPTRAIALVVFPAEDYAPFEAALQHAGGRTQRVLAQGQLPAGAGGLLIAGEGSLDSGSVPPALTQALELELPVLGIGWGMHVLNAACGGGLPVPVEGHAGGTEGALRHRAFLSPGGKVSYTIGGSGWVTVNSNHTHGLRDGQRAPSLLASAYAEDRVIEAVELPGPGWVVGVQWSAHRTGELPSGFDNLLLALVERSQGT